MWPTLAAVASILLLTVGVARAGGTSTIEGVWSFNGGQIAIQPEGNGKFEGIVVSPTRFATCTHPDGQKIWKEMIVQSDGSYWGFHQWYKTSSCTENPILGPTAWRVVEESNGSRYLRICLSHPRTAQPTIPPGSQGVGASYGCQSSALTAPLANSSVGSFKQVVSVSSAGGSPSGGVRSLLSAKKCLSAREFAIHVRGAKYDPFKSVVVTLAGHRLKVTNRGSMYTATINLKGLPAGAFTLKIVAITFRGNHLSGRRTYHTCARRSKKSKPKKLT